MDQTINLTAHSCSITPQKEIESILKELGDEKRGRQIAREIVRRRSKYNRRIEQCNC